MTRQRRFSAAEDLIGLVALPPWRAGGCGVCQLAQHPAHRWSGAHAAPTRSVRSPSSFHAAVPYGTAKHAISAELAGTAQAMVRRLARHSGGSEFSAGCRGTREIQRT